METMLLFAARGARRRVEVTERTFTDGGASGWPQRTERAYSVKGAGARDGSLYTDSWTREDAITRAIACFRRHNPKARLVVSWCRPCMDAGATWDVHEGTPSWHQQRAGAIGAAVTSGFQTEAQADAYASKVRARGETALVLRHRGECKHKV